MQPGAPKSKRTTVAPQVGNLLLNLHGEAEDEHRIQPHSLGTRSADACYVKFGPSSNTVAQSILRLSSHMHEDNMRILISNSGASQRRSPCAHRRGRRVHKSLRTACGPAFQHQQAPPIKAEDATSAA